MDQSTPESSPSIFNDRADKIINLLNKTGSDLESSIIVNNEYPDNAEFWTRDEVLDSSIMDGTAANDTIIEEVQEKEQPASIKEAILYVLRHILFPTTGKEDFVCDNSGAKTRKERTLYSKSTLFRYFWRYSIYWNN
uniref:Uncharacterized protein n=1 Tax=Tetranychus urticae TaxID=32264 RepID=T1KZ11_TETUR